MFNMVNYETFEELVNISCRLSSLFNLIDDKINNREIEDDLGFIIEDFIKIIFEVVNIPGNLDDYDDYGRDYLRELFFDMKETGALSDMGKKYIYNNPYNQILYFKDNTFKEEALKNAK